MPVLAAIGGFQNARAVITAVLIAFARARPNHLRIGGVNRNVADHQRRRFFGQRLPRIAVVIRTPYAALCCAEINRAIVLSIELRMKGQRRHAPRTSQPLLTVIDGKLSDLLPDGIGAERLPRELFDVGAVKIQRTLLRRSGVALFQRTLQRARRNRFQRISALAIEPFGAASAFAFRTDVGALAHDGLTRKRKELRQTKGDAAEYDQTQQQ